MKQYLLSTDAYYDLALRPKTGRVAQWAAVHHYPVESLLVSVISVGQLRLEMNELPPSRPDTIGKKLTAMRVENMLQAFNPFVPFEKSMLLAWERIALATPFTWASGVELDQDYRKVIATAISQGYILVANQHPWTQYAQQFGLQIEYL